jgi:hypothetical protein
VDASYILINLACCSIGEKKVVESGGIDVLLAAVNNHLGFRNVCDKVCWALYNTGVLITLGVELLLPKSDVSGQMITMFKGTCEDS